MMIPIQIECAMYVSALIENSDESIYQLFSTFLLEEYSRVRSIQDMSDYYIEDLTFRCTSINEERQTLTFQLSGYVMNLGEDTNG